ncbi:iron-siderophore ABC transporter substrate-binding protein [Paenibacillus sp. TRM 82003]|nr:iron-siderophore ABC transporter substrate-binding protein [Paenibacillus sp. TRM 82003]
MLKRNTWVMILLAMMLVLAACGQSGTEGDGTSGSGAAEQPAAEAPKAEEPKAEEPKAEAEPAKEEAAAEAGPLTIQHALGEAKFEKTPERVVALEWAYAEDVLALGVQPVGVADIAGYKGAVNISVELGADVVDVGTRQEPNLEAIAQLKPDVIIAPKFRHEAIQKELEAIAPTLFFDAYPTDESTSQYDEMEATFKTIAQVLNKTAVADAVLAELDQAYADAKAKIEAAGLATNEFVLTQAYTAKQVPVLRLFTPNAMASVIFEKIGLKNAFASEKFEVYGFSAANVEALPAVEQANFIYIVQDDDNVFETSLKENAVWKNLAFVKEGRTFALGGDAWVFGGPLSAKTLVDRVTGILVK